MSQITLHALILALSWYGLYITTKICNQLVTVPTVEMQLPSYNLNCYIKEAIHTTGLELSLRLILGNCEQLYTIC